MPILSIIFGILLDLVGILGYAISGAQSWTALIPSILGTILLLCGIFSLVKPNLRKHLMHVAAAVGLIGFLGCLRGVMKLPALLSGAELERPYAVISQNVTALLCIIFVALCVNSFVQARILRKQG